MNFKSFFTATYYEYHQHVRLNIEGKWRTCEITKREPGLTWDGKPGWHYIAYQV
jgi:hypothetical protein